MQENADQSNSEHFLHSDDGKRGNQVLQKQR